MPSYQTFACRSVRRWSRSLIVVGCGALVMCQAAVAAPTEVTVEKIMGFTPIQQDVDYEKVPKDEWSKCKLETEKDEKTGKIFSYIALGPQGQILRKMVDTNKDEVVDQVRYFKFGLEVYREIDSNADGKIDQFRWLNSAGSRWGLDSKQTGKSGNIDRWKVISAEEATREAVRALAERNEAMLQAVMLVPEDLKTIGVSGETAAELTKQCSGIGEQMKTVITKAKLTKETAWTRFDSSMFFPLSIPAEKGKCDRDLSVYANIIVMTESGGKSTFLQIGEMVRVGDAWKLTSVPKMLDPDAKDGFQTVLLKAENPVTDGVDGAQNNLPPEFVKLLEALRDLDLKMPAQNATAAEAEAYYAARIGLLRKIAEKAPPGAVQEDWYKQLLDGIANAYQLGAYKKGLTDLENYEKLFRDKAKDSMILPYIVYRIIVSEHHNLLPQANTEERTKLLEKFLKSLQVFVKEFPKADDSPEAFWNLATLNEFSGKMGDARDWYEKLARGYAESPWAVKAKGALHRLTLKGKPVQIKGSLLGGGTLNTEKLKGKVVAVVFWTSWSRPFAEDLPKLLEMYAKYQDKGFEVIGVNLDNKGVVTKEYCVEHKISFPNIIDEAGFDNSAFSAEFGIISLPTTFLIDKTGTAVLSGATLEDLKGTVPELLLKK